MRKTSWMIILWNCNLSGKYLSKWSKVVIQFWSLEAVIGNFVFNSGAVNGNLASIIKNQFYAGCVYVELTGYKFAHGHTSKMFFEVSQAVNFRVIIGGNHTETRCKSFKISRCERLVRIKQPATKRL